MQKVLDCGKINISNNRISDSRRGNENVEQKEGSTTRPQADSFQKASIEREWDKRGAAFDRKLDQTKIDHMSATNKLAQNVTAHAPPDAHAAKGLRMTRPTASIENEWASHGDALIQKLNQTKSAYEKKLGTLPGLVGASIANEDKKREIKEGKRKVERLEEAPTPRKQEAPTTKKEVAVSAVTRPESATNIGQPEPSASGIKPFADTGNYGPFADIRPTKTVLPSDTKQKGKPSVDRTSYGSFAEIISTARPIPILPSASLSDNSVVRITGSSPAGASTAEIQPESPTRMELRTTSIPVAQGRPTETPRIREAIIHAAAVNLSPSMELEGLAKIEELVGLNSTLSKTIPPAFSPSKVLGGGILGLGLSVLCGKSQITALPHEEAHALTADLLTTEPCPIQADFIDNAKAMGSVSSVQDFFSKLGALISGEDSNHDDLVGAADLREEYNDLASPNISRAAFDLAGSLPDLFLNSLLSYFGTKVSGGTGAAMLTFGMSSHVLASTYPFSVISKSESGLASAAYHGNDFASFALNISSATGVSPHAIAAATASIYTGFVPIVAALGFWAHKDPIKDGLTHAIMYKVFEKAKQEPSLSEALEKAYSKYTNKDKEKLEKEADEYQRSLHDAVRELLQPQSVDGRISILEKLSKASQKWDKIEKNFLTHMKKGLPRDLKKSLKNVVLEEKGIKETRTQRIARVSIFSGIGGIASLQFLASLGKTSVHALAPIASGMTYVCPVLSALGVVGGAWQAYVDHKNHGIPQSAKTISKVSLGISSVLMGAGIATLILPPLALVTIPLMIAGAVSLIALRVKRLSIIQKNNVRIEEGMKTTHWMKNYLLLSKYRDPQEVSNLTTEQFESVSLWLKTMQAAARSGKIDARSDFRNLLTPLLNVQDDNDLGDDKDLVDAIKRTRQEIKREKHRAATERGQAERICEMPTLATCAPASSEKPSKNAESLWACGSSTTARNGGR